MFKKFWNWLTSLFDEDKRIKQQLMTGTLKKVEVEGISYYIKRVSAQFIFDLQVKQKAHSKGKKISEQVAEDVIYELTSAAVCNKKGKPLFTKEDARRLNIFVLNSLVVESMDYNGLNPDAVEKGREKLKNLKGQSNA